MWATLLILSCTMVLNCILYCVVAAAGAPNENPDVGVPPRVKPVGALNCKDNCRF